MVQITLFEVHLDDSTLTANAPFSDSASDESGTLEGMGSEADESSSSKLPAFAGLVLLVGMGLALRRFLGGSDVEEMGLDESEVDLEA